MIASSGTWRSLWLRISCYSWCLPPPRWLGAAEEDWHELVIARGHLPVIVRGLAPSPVKRCKVALVNCSCHWVTSLVGRLLRRLLWWARCVISISHRTTKCWSTQRGLACQLAHEPQEKNWLSLALWYSPGDWIGIHLMIGSLLYVAVYSPYSLIYIPVN